jgi:phage shock protein PspC (stress-responsive transcriptional regulator)
MAAAPPRDNDGAMTETPQQDRINTEHLRDYSQLRRSVTDRKIAGVAGGLGRHLNIDPTVLRVLFVVLALFGGAGLLLYGAFWLFVPEEGKDTAPIATSPSTRTTVLIVASVLAFLLLVGDSWGDIWFPWPLAILALVVALVLMNRDKPVSTTYPPPQPGAPGSEPVTGGAAPAAPSEGAEDTAVYGTDPYYGAAPPTPTPYPVQQPPAPRPERGPKLFWFTVALLAVALGSLGLYDVAQGGVADGAYPALALAVIGVMLLVGAWFGRPGGLIALGVVAVIALVGASANDYRFEDPRVVTIPGSTAELEDSYTFSAGATHLNLSRITDLEALDGRTIDVEGNVGEIVVTVPDDVDVNVDARIGMAGDVTVMGETRSGPGVVAIERTIDGGEDVPELDLNLDLQVGNIEVRQ